MRKKLLSEKSESKFLAYDNTSMESSSEPKTIFCRDKIFGRHFTTHTDLRERMRQSKITNVGTNEVNNLKE